MKEVKFVCLVIIPFVRPSNDMLFVQVLVQLVRYLPSVTYPGTMTAGINVRPVMACDPTPADG